MRRIVKSSHVAMGEKKEIREGNPYDSLDSLNKPQMNKIPNHNEHDVKSIHQKIKETDELIQTKLNEARTQAQSIISEAYEDSKTIFQNAKTEGYTEGYSEGFHAGKNESDKLIEEALSIKKQIQSDKEKMVKELEDEIVSLIIATSEKILYTNLDESRETILGLVKLGLEKCTYTESLILRVCPHDYEYVQSVKNKILCLAENIEDISIKQDASLNKGSCILDTVSGSIDSSIKTQLDHISSIFHDLLGSE